MTHTVDDRTALIDEKQISVPAHQFDNEAHLDGVHEFIPPGEREYRDAVQTLLRDRNDAAADQIFAEQHAKRGRSLRILIILRDRLDAAVLGMDTKHQFHTPRVRRVYMQDHDIFVGLLHLVDLAADKRLQLMYARVQGKSVRCHSCSYQSYSNRTRAGMQEKKEKRPIRTLCHANTGVQLFAAASFFANCAFLRSAAFLWITPFAADWSTILTAAR